MGISVVKETHMDGSDGSVTSSNEANPKAVQSESPVGEDAIPRISTNGHLNGVSKDHDTFVQGHSKEGLDEARGESRTPNSIESDIEKCQAEDEDEENEVGDEEEDDQDEEDEDEEEPALKYERLGGAAAELLEKDTASAVAVSLKFLVMGTHSGIVHVLDYQGNRIRSYRPHSASINEMCIDTTGDFVGTASVDGQVVIHSLSTPESYAFDLRRPMRTISLDPQFAKSGSRAFVCGGMAGTLVMHEKGWLGHKETVLHTGEGPIWTSKWRGNLIAWANDLGVKIYDTDAQVRITYVDRPPDSPRADLFKCNLYWQDDATLLIAWADYIKVARVRARPRPTTGPSSLPPLYVEVTAAFQLDCMISGIVPHPTPPSPTAASLQAPKSFLVLAYIAPDKFSNEATIDRAEQARKAANRPELRIISRVGEELSSDELSLNGFHLFGCNDYALAEMEGISEGPERCYVVLSPRNIVLVRPRDMKDHVEWLVEQKKYEKALEVMETMEGESMDASLIGQQYVEHLFEEGEYEKAAHLAPKVFGQTVKLWENWIFRFAQQHRIDTIIPYVPTDTPQLSRLVYEMILAHFLTHDPPALLRTIKEWPKSIYDTSAVIVAVQAELDRIPSTGVRGSLLMECLAELYISNRQPGKALPFFLRLRRPNVFDLIRENNLFTAVQDQALLLVEFDQELVEKSKAQGEDVQGRSAAIALLVDHTHSIPIARVVNQLQIRPYFLYLYLDALFDKDPQLTSEFTDLQVKLYAEYQPSRLIDFLRASNYYSLEKAYAICHERDLVLEMVYLLGRMGNNKKALHLIIERMNDVNRAIDFAKEQNDDDLWEDLLRYSETRPPFIRGLLENVGAEIDPIRLIRRIKNGLEIPGLKDALIKILQDFNLQISLLEGCQTILHSDCTDLAWRLQKNQTSGFFLSGASLCMICSLPLHDSSQSLTLLFLCRHVVHARCTSGGEDLPRQPDALLGIGSPGRGISGKIAFAAMVRARIDKGCPVCHRKNEGERTS
ncbi:vacuolar protein sorting-associated protein 41 [Ramaria rubella]|nr:vacuolar protein sorting-associated protein 41 [Ramaria rubella]